MRISPSLSIFVAAVLALDACGAPAPPSSLHDGRLGPCSALPHCVSTAAGEDAGHAMPAIPFADPPASALSRARAAVLAEPGATIVDERGGYLHAEVRSRTFHFVDDLELLVDSTAHRIQFRSSARVGYNDWSVNRHRMERITSRLGRTH